MVHQKESALQNCTKAELLSLLNAYSVFLLSLHIFLLSITMLGMWRKAIFHVRFREIRKLQILFAYFIMQINENYAIIISPVEKVFPLSKSDTNSN